MGRAISFFQFDLQAPTPEQIHLALKERTGLDIQLTGADEKTDATYCFFSCKGFDEIELDINHQTQSVSCMYDTILVKRFYKKGEAAPYLYLMLEAVLYDLGCNGEKRLLPEWTKKKWAEIGWLTRRTEIYK